MTGRAALARAATVAGALGLALPEIVAGLGPTPAGGKVGTPGLAWFAGTYDRVGHDGADPPVRLRDTVTLTFGDDRIDMTDCDGRRMQLIHDPSFDYADHLVGYLDGAPLDCQFRNDGAGRPVLTCASESGAAFTLWPIAGKVGAGGGSCAP